MVYIYYNSEIQGIMGEGNKKRKAKDSIKIRLLINNWVENREYLKHDISIEKLGKLIGINRTYVSNYINDTYNLNFNTWVHSMRIAEAKKIILSSSDMSMGQVAIITGYADQAHFSKQFKMITGMSPVKWKKGQTEGRKEITA